MKIHFQGGLFLSSSGLAGAISRPKRHGDLFLRRDQVMTN